MAPLGSSLGELVALGCILADNTLLMELLTGVVEMVEVMEVLGGGEGGLACTEAFDPITGMDMPWSGAAGAGSAGPGAATGAATGAGAGAATGAVGLSTNNCFGGLAPSSMSDVGLGGLLAGEVMGVPESVFVELSR